MTEDVLKWTVTYTKHIKQKRKVYQDGFLVLQSSSHKVKLYDDCDKLLDSKIVKLDDTVRSGETITFGSYLVDIGDLHGESKPIPNPILQRDKTMANRNGAPNSRFRKGNLHTPRASSINLSPSEKIIREFKRREVKKYSCSPSCQDTTKVDPTEWQVLYTTHLTQKAKKFHDGILRVADSGLRGRQAVLYDETRRLLDSIFLKKEETVRAGASLRFDGHIVDITELKVHEPLKEKNAGISNCYTQNTMQSKIHNEHLEEFRKSETNKSSVKACTAKPKLREWDVMYNTQVTQKGKKYHDGVLKLANSGSRGRQEATLLSEDGMVLSHRYLKLSEDINGGSLFNMTNYLVEIGEPRKLSEGECPKKASKLENEVPDIRSIDADNIKLCNRIPATRPLSDGKPPKTASSLQDTDSKVRNSIPDKAMSATISKNKPIRDAHSILSFLKKPATQQSIFTEKVHADKLLPSEASAVVQVDKQQDPCSRSEETVYNVETRDVDVGGHPEMMSSKATFILNFNEPAKKTKNQSNTEISGANRTADSSVHDISNDRKKGFEHTNSRDEFPSFDLGFD